MRNILANVVCVLAVAIALPAFAQDTPEKVANARPGDMRLFVSNGLREPFNDVRSEAEKHLGKQFVVEYGSSRVMQGQMEADQAFDVAILTATAIADLSTKGQIVAGSETELAVSRSRFGALRTSTFRRPMRLKQHC